ncbi:MAG TPA: phosphotransferase [Mycobacteriales bacterium]|nr:phosphotransferase [Mycobacteriales bacterium]
MELDRAREAAARWRPELAGAPAVRYGGGGRSSTLAIGDWLLRFPRRPEVVDELVREQRVLDAIAPLLPVAVPRSRPVGVLEDGTPFFAHPLIPGEPLDEPTARLGLVVSQLAGLLHALHAVPARQVTDLGVPVLDAGATRRWVHETAGRAVTDVLPLLPGSLRTAAAADWDAILAEVAGWSFAPVVCHGALYPSNILVQRGRGVVTGVLDWADVRVGDPAADLAGIAAAMAPGIDLSIAMSYADDDGAAELVGRARVMARISRYADVLTSAARPERRSADATLATLRSQLTAQ